MQKVSIPTVLEIKNFRGQRTPKQSLEDAAAYCSPWERVQWQRVVYLFIYLFYHEKGFQENKAGLCKAFSLFSPEQSGVGPL